MTRAEAERELNSDKNPQEIEASMLKELKKGNPEVFEMLADRAFGKLPQRVEIPGPENLSEKIEAARKRVAAYDRDG